MRFSHLLLLSVAAVASMDVVQAEGLRGQHRALKEGKEDKGEVKELGGSPLGLKGPRILLAFLFWALCMF